ncbi:MAG: UvrD-helicase domain-containing protein [Fibrobacter sp.]|nr:UvrD-helicase domain-containing protein [Fibrobacter sp.]
MANIVDGAVLDRELNPEQAAAAKKIDGPMLILAGAGSGKTRAITYKIAHLVSQYNVEPDRILAVTFTNKAAREMKDRIQKLLDCNMNFRWMGTFHSVCLKLLKLCLSKESVVSAMGGSWYNGNFSIYDDDDQKHLLKDILKTDLDDSIEASELTLLLKKLHAKISHYKNTVLYERGGAVLQTPEVALARVENDEDRRWVRYYAEYQKRLRESNAMDFDDLLFNTVCMFQKIPNLANQLAFRFRYVFVDEYQDTNDVQYELLKLLINENKNVTVVGDDDQSIYGWRGANIGIIRNFHRDFAPVTIVKLERNYRSTANIVKGAGSVIAHNVRPAEMVKKVFSKEDAGDPIRVRHFLADDNYPKTLETNEANAIADCIFRAGSGNYSKTAVFYRTNAQSRVIEKALNDYRIPSVIFGGMRFWDRKEIKDILAYLRLIANEKDDAAHLRVINTPPRTIGKTTVEAILERVHNGEGSFWQILVAESMGAGRASPKLKGFVNLVQRWKSLIAAGETQLPILAETIITDIGYKDFLHKENEPTAEERCANVDEMVNAIREFEESHPNATLDAFLQDISLLTDADKKVDTTKGAVTLMTIHMAKGLEFNTVHIAGCDEGIFPLIRANANDKDMEEERRLFYVGCTRAEKKLYLYHVNKRFFQGREMGPSESRFLREMDPSVVEEKNTTFSGNNSSRFDGFNQDFSGVSGNIFHRPSRQGLSQSANRFSSGSRASSSFSGSGFRGGNVRHSSVPSSVRKNDQRIVYRNPIVVKKLSESSGSHVVYNSNNDNPFHPGTRVRHIKFGVGVVISCSGSGKDAHVQVRFSRDGEIRTILAQFLQVGG